MTKTDHSEPCIRAVELADQALVSCDLEAAEKHYREAADFARQDMQNCGVFLGSIQLSLALALEQQGRKEQALVALTDAFIHRESLTEDGMLLLGDTMADVMMSLGHYRKAIPFCEEAVWRAGRSLGRDHVDVARRVNRAARCYLENGLNEHAAIAYRQAHELLSRHLPATLSDCAVAHLDWGNALLSSNPTEAVDHFRKAAAIWEDRADLQQASSAWVNLAVASTRLGRFDEATALLDRTLKLRGSEGPGAITALENLGDIRRRLEDFAGARSYISRALELAQAHSHFGLASCYQTLAEIAEAEGNIQDAVHWYGRSRAEHQKRPSPDFTELKTAFENEARVLTLTGDDNAASHARDQAQLFATTLAMIPEPRDLLTLPANVQRYIDSADGEEDYAGPAEGEAEGVFDSDDSWEWTQTLQDKNGYDWLARQFRELEREQVLENGDDAVALAAAGVVACGLGRTIPRTPDRVTEWLACRKDTPDASLVDAALRAVDRVSRHSELRDLWKEAGQLDAWLQNIEELKAALGRAN